MTAQPTDLCTCRHMSLEHGRFFDGGRFDPTCQRCVCEGFTPRARMTDADLTDMERIGVAWTTEATLAALLAEVREARRIERLMAAWGEVERLYSLGLSDEKPLYVAYNLVAAEAVALAESERQREGKS